MQNDRRRAVILSGAGRYADPWHPFEQTTARVADFLRDAGFAVEIAENVDRRMAELGTAEDEGVDLLVINVGNPAEPDPADASSRRGLLTYLDRGGPMLALHVSATSFPAIPEWEDILGGIWVRGTTMHPEAGLSRIRIYPGRHSIVAQSSDFDIVDERYSYLRTSPDVVPLATHEHDGLEHPLLWARSYGTARVVYDALGHDAHSYDAPEHRDILRRAALWLVGDLSS